MKTESWDMCCRVTPFFLLILLFSSEVLGGTLHGQWNALLQKYVKNGVVDYTGFKKEEAVLDNYLQFLNEINPEKLSTNEQLALYINGYNSYTIKLILKNFKEGNPVSSIKKIGGFFSSPWKIKFVEIGGKKYTLDNIEHDIIRKRFADPRIHFAVNCASKSCPPLKSEAYEGESIDDQLDENTVAFINNSEFTFFSENTLYVSKIFSWFSEDFKDGAVNFVLRYAESDFKNQVETLKSTPHVKYLDYDWSLNGK